MKKFLTLFLAVVMVLALSIPAFAEEAIESAGGSSNQIPVEIELNKTTEAAVYKVDVSWTDLTFTYTFGNNGTWLPGSHSYTDAVADGWDKDTTTFTVTNHSNVEVEVVASIATTGNNDTVTAVLADGDENGNVTETLARAEAGTEQNEAPSATFTVEIEGTPSREDTNTTVSNITVSLN